VVRCRFSCVLKIEIAVEVKERLMFGGKSRFGGEVEIRRGGCSSEKMLRLEGKKGSLTFEGQVEVQKEVEVRRRVKV
jgi:hypothetical protein